MRHVTSCRAVDGRDHAETQGLLGNCSGGPCVYPGMAFAPEPPSWQRCDRGAAGPDGSGCIGRAVAPHTECLAHLSDAQSEAYFASLAPGSRVDHPGTTFDAALLGRLLNAVRDPETGRPRLSTAGFARATFEGYADFGLACFEGNAIFDAARFKGVAGFGTVTFGQHAGFESTFFEGDARFGSARFEANADFRSASFTRSGWFESAVFIGPAGFGGSRTLFGGPAGFASAEFRDKAEFSWANFSSSVTFCSATFKGDARFESTKFLSAVTFDSATFEMYTEFNSAEFTGEAGFHATNFVGSAWFESSVFRQIVSFGSAAFRSDARFGSARFAEQVTFASAVFEGGTGFESTTLSGDADFSSATFTRTSHLGPLTCEGDMVLTRAVFKAPVTLAITARHLVCRRTRWTSMTALRLRRTTLDFTNAVFEQPLSVSAVPGPGDPPVRVVSLHGVDAAHLVLADVDLSRCPFTGIVHLDQLKLEGICSFAEVPAGTHWQRWLPVRFTPRRTLVEEHRWRACRPGAADGWTRDESAVGKSRPMALAAVYRALRKSFEDSKNEPGAADFYYGEMEMRRHAEETPRAERGLLTAYWALSGYGLRASRAVGWLLLAMAGTVLAMTLWGTPTQSGGATSAHGPGTPSTYDPGNRFDRSLRVVVNSVVFRSSGQDLTTAGAYIEMGARLTEPFLLGLAVLALRGRVKR
ncbi:pentapeptide repeat-containing protein [Streptomyces sp. NPDC001002]